MDGTLTMPVHDFDAIRRHIGIPDNMPILEAIDMMEPAVAIQARQRLHEIEMELAVLATPQPGARETLESLVVRGCVLGILTRNDEAIAWETLRASGLDHLFDLPHVIGRETCMPKPCPDGVLHLLDLWCAKPQNTVMVGDFRYDMEAGKKAGTHTIHFDCQGHFAWPEYTDFGVTSITEILSLMD